MKRIKEFVEGMIDVLDNDDDMPFCIAGKEGRGKSALAYWIYRLYHEKRKRNWTADNIGTDTPRFGRAIKFSQKKDLLWWDEAGDALGNDEQKKKLAVALRKAFMVIRNENLGCIFCIPNWFIMHPYFRKFRINWLFVVDKRGHVKIYDAERIQQLNIDGQKYYNHDAVEPLCEDTYPDFDYKDPVVIEYKVLKNAKTKADKEAIGELLMNTEQKPPRNPPEGLNLLERPPTSLWSKK